MVVAVIFLVQRFLSFRVDFASLFTAKTMPGLVLVTLAVMATLFISSLIWVRWLSFFAKRKIAIPATYSVYVRSNIAKYLPGNVAHYAMRQFYGTSLGIRQKDLLLSSILEIFCSALTALILSLVLAKDVLVSFFENSIHSKLILAIIIVVVVVIVIGAVFFAKKKGFSASDILQYFRQKEFGLSLISVIGLTACNLAIYGTTLLILLGSGAAAGPNSLLIVSAGIVSWFIGFITPGVPGGIGVREAVLLLMLSPVMADDVVLYAAVVQRVAFILSDVLSWVVGKLVERRQAKREYGKSQTIQAPR